MSAAVKERRERRREAREALDELIDRRVAVLVLRDEDGEPAGFFLSPGQKVTPDLARRVEAVADELADLVIATVLPADPTLN